MAWNNLPRETRDTSIPLKQLTGSLKTRMFNIASLISVVSAGFWHFINFNSYSTTTAAAPPPPPPPPPPPTTTTTTTCIL